MNTYDNLANELCELVEQYPPGPALRRMLRLYLQCAHMSGANEALQRGFDELLKVVRHGD